MAIEFIFFSLVLPDLLRGILLKENNSYAECIGHTHTQCCTLIHDTR